ncbi:MAG: hypothetical protein DME20_05260 [Verrucomicrobia bacterium]|nr:MAG: hypothetical protein DME20_05260 [Verrucomicrobiota bacterium]
MGSIPSETIEQIAAANDIVEVIGSYFPLKRAGANFKALCPFHQEKTPSFIVSASRQTFHCFGCGAGGSVFRFVMDYEHIDFPSAVRKLAARAGITAVEKSRGYGADDEERQRELRERLLKLHAEAAKWFHENLIKNSTASEGSGTAQRTAHAKASYDRFRGRIMFPICNDVGEVIAFSGRLLEDEQGAAKYLNSPETGLFRKGSVLFGLDKTKRALIEANCAVVCEGQLDLISLFESGITNVVAPQGTAFTESQARILKRFVNEVVLCFDADTAGQKAAERSLDALLQNDLIVRMAKMPVGEDPDSLVRREGKEAFERRIAGARDFFDYWIERETANIDLASFGAKIQLARRLAETISRVRDPLMRGEVISKVSARLGVPAQDFQALVSRQRGTEPFLARDHPPERDATGVMAPAPRHDISMLCVLALRDETARDFLRQQNWREILANVPDGEPLVRILESDLRPGDAASLNAFMVTLSPADERLVSSWLLQKVPANAGAMVEKWWLGIRQAVLRRKLSVATNQIKLPELSTGDIINLQKQILDLQEQLHELSQPAGAADN